MPGDFAYSGRYQAALTAAGAVPNRSPEDLPETIFQLGQLIGQGPPNQAVTVTTNAGTINPAAGGGLFTFTNSSAATMTITMATAGAVDGQQVLVRVYDFSAASQTITWVNTENGEGTAPTSSNGSTTLPKTALFMFNGATTKWRCIVS